MNCTRVNSKIHTHSPFSFECRTDIPMQWRTQEFCSGGVQQIQLRTKDRENGDLGAVAP